MTTPTGMVTPPSLDDQNVGETLNTKGWLRSRIMMESLPVDVMTSNQGIIDPIKPESEKQATQVTSDKPILKITEKDNGVFKSDGSVTIALQLALNGAGFEGNVQINGTEENARWKSLTVSANIFGNAISTFGFGIDYLDQSWLGLDSKKIKLLSQWYGEKRGLQMRQAYTTGVSQELAAAPTSLTETINSNVIFAEVGMAGTEQGQVPWATTGFVADVAVAAALTTPADNHLDMGRVLQLSDQASDELFLKPIMIEGGSYYILYTAKEEVRRLRNSAVNGSYAKDFIEVAAFPPEVKKVVPNAVFMIDNILIVPDTRAATMSTNGTTTADFGYRLPGKGTSRHVPDALAFNTNILVGAEAIVEYARQGVSFAKNEDGYGMFKGDAIYSVSSFTLCQFDLDTNKGDTTLQNEGSALILTAREQAIGK